MVIVPTVAARLANGNRLPRVIVAKPQARQMLDILVPKLGGLLNRRVYQLPVSRSTSFTASMVGTIMRSCEQCMREGGVVLAQPEHILSLQLMTIQKAIAGESELAARLWKVHEFLESNARDIVDESDENLSTKFELIYTMGFQRAIEHGPLRWIMIQEVLAEILRSTRTAEREYPKEIEIDHSVRPSFPIIRFLSKEVSDTVIRSAVDAFRMRGDRFRPSSKAMACTLRTRPHARTRHKACCAFPRQRQPKRPFRIQPPRCSHLLTSWSRTHRCHCPISFAKRRLAID